MSIYYKPSLFNAHTMILIVHIFMNVNKLCLNKTETETDRQTDRQTDREERQTDRQSPAHIIRVTGFPGEIAVTLLFLPKIRKTSQSDAHYSFSLPHLQT